MTYTILYNKLNKYFIGQLRKKNTGFLYQYHLKSNSKLMYLKIILNMKQEMVSKATVVFTFEPVPYKTAKSQLARWEPYMEL